MRGLLVLGAALLTAGCGATPVDERGDHPTASPGAITYSEQAEMLKEKNISPTTGEVSSTPSVATDNTRRFEFADIYVNLGDPQGQRVLVPYLLKPEEWILTKCEMLTATSRHYRFQRVVANDGRRLPEVDPLRPRR